MKVDMRAIACLAITWVLLLLVCVAVGMQMTLGPPQVICVNSDLIVVAKFTGTAAIEAKRKQTLEEIIQPGEFRKENYELKDCLFEVMEVIKPDVAQEHPKKLSTVAYFPIDGDNRMRVVCPPDAPYLTVGERYVLLLSRLGDGPDYYVSARSELTAEATPEHVAEVRLAANPDLWPWSEPVNGLRLALMTTDYDTIDGDKSVSAFLAVCNASSKDITLDAKAGVEAKEADGKDVAPHAQVCLETFIREGKSPSSQPATQPTSSPATGRHSGQAPAATTRPLLEMMGPMLHWAPLPECKMTLHPGAIVLIKDDCIYLKSKRGTLRGVLEANKTQDPDSWVGKIQTAEIQIGQPPAKKP
jgi:hypothetical protein